MTMIDPQIEKKLFGGGLLWRHRPDNFKNNHTIDEIEKNYVYFCKPSELNDPYDCSFDLVKTKVSKAGKLKYFQKMSQGRNRSELRSDAKELANNTDDKVFECADKQVLENMGVASFTRSCGNLMLWSHYSNFHKGICLGFNKHVDLDYFASISMNYIKTPGDYKPFEYDSANTKEYKEAMKHLVSQKTYLWNNEEEFRIIQEKSGQYKFPTAALEFLILGIQTNDKFQNDVLEAISNNKRYCNLKVLKMLPNEENIFGLKFKEIEYSR